MINGERLLILIGARGGSKGVPGKNIKNLGGKPLIAWTIEAALKSDYADRVIVSSDSNEILSISRKFGADTPFIRPPELATDIALQEDAILHAMEWVEKNDKPYKYLMLLQPTSPFRDAVEVNEIINFFSNHSKAKSVVAVRPCDHSPLWSNTLPEDRSMKDFIRKEVINKNRQELPDFYQIAGSTFISEWKLFKENSTFFTKDTFAYITDGYKGLDIDNHQDFLIAEYYINQNKNS